MGVCSNVLGCFQRHLLKVVGRLKSNVKVTGIVLPDEHKGIMVVGCWKEIEVNGKASYKVASKLRFLKDEMKKWRKEEELKEEERMNSII